MATPAQKKLVQKRLADIREAKSARFKWTGFAGKTLWEWMQLLIVPVILLGATIGFGWWQAHLADLQHQNDIQIANDQQQEATLQSYLDDMTTLLLDKKLGSQVVADKAASDIEGAKFIGIPPQGFGCDAVLLGSQVLIDSGGDVHVCSFGEQTQSACHHRMNWPVERGEWWSRFQDSRNSRLNGLGSPVGIETASPGPPQHPANVRPLEHGL